MQTFRKYPFLVIKIRKDLIHPSNKQEKSVTNQLLSEQKDPKRGKGHDSTWEFEPHFR